MAKETERHEGPVWDKDGNASGWRTESKYDDGGSKVTEREVNSGLLGEPVPGKVTDVKDFTPKD